MVVIDLVPLEYWVTWPELGLRGALVFVDRPCDDRSSADRPQAGYVAAGLRFDVRGPLLPGLVRPVAVVTGHVLAEHQVQVAVTVDRGPVQQLAAQGSR